MLKQKTKPAAGMTEQHLEMLGSLDLQNGDYIKWLAAQGSTFTEVKKLPEIYMPRINIKQCFSNSAIITFSTDFDYYEGYYVNKEIPIPLPHAFNVNPATGEAFDATVQKFGFNTIEWFGTKVPPEALIEWVEDERTYETPLEYYYKKYIKKS